MNSSQRRVDHDLTLQATSSVALLQIHGMDLESEVLKAYEAGYRTQIHPRIFTDIATFYNHYNFLRNSRAATAFFEGGKLVIPVFFDDKAKADTYGVELSNTIRVLNWWQLKTAYTLFRMKYRFRQDVVQYNSTLENESPKHQIFVGSHIALPKNTQFDTEIRYVDALRAYHVQSYWEMNLRLGWRPCLKVLTEVIATNMFHNHHKEFVSSYTPQIEKAVYAKTTVEF